VVFVEEVCYVCVFFGFGDVELVDVVFGVDFGYCFVDVLFCEDDWIGEVLLVVCYCYYIEL